MTGTCGILMAAMLWGVVVIDRLKCVLVSNYELVSKKKISWQTISF